jgi:NNP family nitrate/nitrite transporter-like MFS transporter
MKLSRLFLFWSLWYLAFSSRTIISPLLPLIEKELAISHASAGGLYMFMAMGTTLAVGMAGVIALKVGYKRLIILGFVLLGLVTGSLVFARSYQMFAALFFGVGIFSGVYVPCAMPIITTVFERRHWGRVLAFHETAAGFSLLSMPVIIAFLLEVVPWRWSFGLIAAAMGLAILAFWTSAPDPPPTAAEKITSQFLLKRLDFYLIGIVWVICGVASVGIYNIIPLYLVYEKAMALEQANRLFSLSRIGGFVGQICIGFFLDRYSTKKILLFLVTASGVFTVGLALAQTHGMLAVMLLLQASFCVVFFPVGMMAISKVTTVRERGVFTGAVMAVSGMVSIGVAPLVLGAIADVAGFGRGLLLVGIITLCACPLMVWLKGVE